MKVSIKIVAYFRHCYNIDLESFLVVLPLCRTADKQEDGFVSNSWNLALRTVRSDSRTNDATGTRSPTRARILSQPARRLAHLPPWAMRAQPAKRRPGTTYTIDARTHNNKVSR